MTASWHGPTDSEQPRDNHDLLARKQDAPPTDAMINRLVLLLGGSRSGKSKLATDLASRWTGPVTFIATAEPGDEEMAARIAAHQRQRPAQWGTIEEPIDIAAALRNVGPADGVVLDCLTLWVSNLLAVGHSNDEVRQIAIQTAESATARGSPTIVVSNEVGSGLVPTTALGRRYREVLGDVNQIWAEAAGDAYLVVAGRVLDLAALKPSWETVQ